MRKSVWEHKRKNHSCFIHSVIHSRCIQIKIDKRYQFCSSLGHKVWKGPSLKMINWWFPWSEADRLYNMHACICVKVMRINHLVLISWMQGLSMKSNFFTFDIQCLQILFMCDHCSDRLCLVEWTQGLYAVLALMSHAF